MHHINSWYETLRFKTNKVTKTEAMVWNYCNTLKLSLSLYSISNIINEKKAVFDWPKTPSDLVSVEGRRCFCKSLHETLPSQGISSALLATQLPAPACVFSPSRSFYNGTPSGAVSLSLSRASVYCKLRGNTVFWRHGFIYVGKEYSPCIFWVCLWQTRHQVNI